MKMDAIPEVGAPVLGAARQMIAQRLLPVGGAFLTRLPVPCTGDHGVDPLDHLYDHRLGLLIIRPLDDALIGGSGVASSSGVGCLLFLFVSFLVFVFSSFG